MQGQAAYDLEAFDKSEKMSEIWNKLYLAANDGKSEMTISFDVLGLTRDAILTITVLRMHGYQVKFGNNEIEVKW